MNVNNTSLFKLMGVYVYLLILDYAVNEQILILTQECLNLQKQIQNLHTLNEVSTVSFNRFKLTEKIKLSNNFSFNTSADLKTINILNPKNNLWFNAPRMP